MMMMMPLYCAAAAASSVQEQVMVWKAWSPDHVQWEAPTWRHRLWHSQPGMCDIHSSCRTVIGQHHFCMYLPQDPARLVSRKSQLLVSLCFSFISRHEPCLWLSNVFYFVRDVTLLVGWFDELTSALRFSPGWNTLEILGLLFQS